MMTRLFWVIFTANLGPEYVGNIYPRSLKKPLARETDTIKIWAILPNCQVSLARGFFEGTREKYFPHKTQETDFKR